MGNSCGCCRRNSASSTSGGGHNAHASEEDVEANGSLLEAHESAAGAGASSSSTQTDRNGVAISVSLATHQYSQLDPSIDPNSQGIGIDGSQAQSSRSPGLLTPQYMDVPSPLAPANSTSSQRSSGMFGGFLNRMSISWQTGGNQNGLNDVKQRASSASTHDGDLVAMQTRDGSTSRGSIAGVSSAIGSPRKHPKSPRSPVAFLRGFGSTSPNLHHSARSNSGSLSADGPGTGDAAAALGSGGVMAVHPGSAALGSSSSGDDTGPVKPPSKRSLKNSGRKLTLRDDESSTEDVGVHPSGAIKGDASGIATGADDSGKTVEDSETGISEEQSRLRVESQGRLELDAFEPDIAEFIAEICEMNDFWQDFIPVLMGYPSATGATGTGLPQRSAVLSPLTTPEMTERRDVFLQRLRTNLTTELQCLLEVHKEELSQLSTSVVVYESDYSPLRHMVQPSLTDDTMSLSDDDEDGDSPVIGTSGRGRSASVLSKRARRNAILGLRQSIRATERLIKSLAKLRNVAVIVDLVTSVIMQVDQMVNMQAVDMVTLHNTISDLTLNGGSALSLTMGSTLKLAIDPSNSHMVTPKVRDDPSTEGGRRKQTLSVSFGTPLAGSLSPEVKSSGITPFVKPGDFPVSPLSNSGSATSRSGSAVSARATSVSGSTSPVSTPAASSAAVTPAVSTSPAAIHPSGSSTVAGSTDDSVVRTGSTHSSPRTTPTPASHSVTIEDVNSGREIRQAFKAKLRTISSGKSTDYDAGHKRAAKIAVRVGIDGTREQPGSGSDGDREDESDERGRRDASHTGRGSDRFVNVDGESDSDSSTPSTNEKSRLNNESESHTSGRGFVVKIEGALEDEDEDSGLTMGGVYGVSMELPSSARRSETQGDSISGVVGAVDSVDRLAVDTGHESGGETSSFYTSDSFEEKDPTAATSRTSPITSLTFDDVVTHAKSNQPKKKHAPRLRAGTGTGTGTSSGREKRSSVTGHSSESRTMTITGFEGAQSPPPFEFDFLATGTRHSEVYLDELTDAQMRLSLRVRQEWVECLGSLDFFYELATALESTISAFDDMPDMVEMFRLSVRDSLRQVFEIFRCMVLDVSLSQLSDRMETLYCDDPFTALIMYDNYIEDYLEFWEEYIDDFKSLRKKPMDRRTSGTGSAPNYHLSLPLDGGSGSDGAYKLSKPKRMQLSSLIYTRISVEADFNSEQMDEMYKAGRIDRFTNQVIDFLTKTLYFFKYNRHAQMMKFFEDLALIHKRAKIPKESLTIMAHACQDVFSKTEPFSQYWTNELQMANLFIWQFCGDIIAQMYDGASSKRILSPSITPATATHSLIQPSTTEFELSVTATRPPSIEASADIEVVPLSKYGFGGSSLSASRAGSKLTPPMTAGTGPMPSLRASVSMDAGSSLLDVPQRKGSKSTTYATPTSPISRSVSSMTAASAAAGGTPSFGAFAVRRKSRKGPADSNSSASHLRGPHGRSGSAISSLMKPSTREESSSSRSKLTRQYSHSRSALMDRRKVKRRKSTSRLSVASFNAEKFTLQLMNHSQKGSVNSSDVALLMSSLKSSERFWRMHVEKLSESQQSKVCSMVVDILAKDENKRAAVEYGELLAKRKKPFNFVAMFSVFFRHLRQLFGSKHISGVTTHVASSVGSGGLSSAGLLMAPGTAPSLAAPTVTASVTGSDHHPSSAAPRKPTLTASSTGTPLYSAHSLSVMKPEESVRSGEYELSRSAASMARIHTRSGSGLHHKRHSSAMRRHSVAASSHTRSHTLSVISPKSSAARSHVSISDSTSPVMVTGVGSGSASSSSTTTTITEPTAFEAFLDAMQGFGETHKKLGISKTLIKSVVKAFLKVLAKEMSEVWIPRVTTSLNVTLVFAVKCMFSPKSATVTSAGAAIDQQHRQQQMMQRKQHTVHVIEEEDGSGTPVTLQSSADVASRLAAAPLSSVATSPSGSSTTSSSSGLSTGDILGGATPKRSHTLTDIFVAK